MQLPNREDFLDFVEGVNSQNPVAQKKVLSLLGSSAAVREQIAELKRDLYLVNAQVPDYQLSISYASELNKLAMAWHKLGYNRSFSLRNFYRSRELFALLGMILGGLMLVFALLGMVTRYK